MAVHGCGIMAQLCMYCRTQVCLNNNAASTIAVLSFDMQPGLQVKSLQYLMGLGTLLTSIVRQHNLHINNYQLASVRLCVATCF